MAKSPRSRQTGEPLAAWGLSHRFGQYYYTYFTSVTFRSKVAPVEFYRHINAGAKKLNRFTKNRQLRLNIVAITFGPADAMIIWQAKRPEVAKAFRDTVLAGNPIDMTTKTSVAMMSDGFGR